MNDITLPIGYYEYGDDRWRLWCSTISEARVSPYEDQTKPRKWYHPDDLPKKSQQVILGIRGLPRDLAFRWMMEGYQPLPEEVIEAIRKESG